MAPEEPKGWANARSRLLEKMRSALTASHLGFVNLSIPKHTVTTVCLREIAFDSSLAGRALDVRWSDGSQSSFPCGAIVPVSSVVTTPMVGLRLGLMSFRHPELDYLVDLYACRNRELAILKSMAAEEAYAFDRAREVLCDVELKDGANIEVFHTGLEPMVVGFYRGLVSVLAERRAKGQPRTLQVWPLFYAGKPEKGRLTPDSDGAKRENYICGTVWM